jgi:hypothetical protein
MFTLFIVLIVLLHPGQSSYRPAYVSRYDNGEVVIAQLFPPRIFGRYKEQNDGIIVLTYPRTISIIDNLDCNNATVDGRVMYDVVNDRIIPHHFVNHDIAMIVHSICSDQI